MSRMEEPNDTSTRLLSALLTVKHHKRHARCPLCGIDGCPQLEWAEEVLAQYRQMREED